MKKYFAIFIAIFGVVTLYSTAQMVDTKARMGISKDSIMLGDTLSLFINIDKDMASEISIPMFKDGKLTDKLEIIEGPIVDTLYDENRTIGLRINYVITAFDAGNYILDSFPVLTGTKEPFDTLFARGNDVLVVGTFAIDTTQDVPEDIKPIQDAPFSWAEFKAYIADNWIVILAILVVIGVIAFGVWWYIKRKRALRAARKAVPPHLRAINSLENIRNQKLWQSGQVKEYFSAITDVLRTYMEDRYGISAMEMTSKEILAALRSMHTEEKLLKSMGELFAMADLAKFAKATPEAEECETAYFDAYYYVEQTKPIEIEEVDIDKLEDHNVLEVKTEIEKESSTKSETPTNKEAEAERKEDEK